MTETHTCDTFTYGLQDDDFDLTSAPDLRRPYQSPAPRSKSAISTAAHCCRWAAKASCACAARRCCTVTGKRPEESAAVLKDGWLHTGDLGQITEQGFIRYLGRRKEMLKVNGMSVFPSELEAMLGQHPSLLASAVIGRADASSGQRPVAFVVLKAGSHENAASLHSWCKEVMASYKVPEIRVVEALPMTATGKVKKNELESQL